MGDSAQQGSLAIPDRGAERPGQLNLAGKRVLFVSNGHGEDLNASLVLKALVQEFPAVKVAALPLVGEGNAYRRLDVPLITPTRSFPSGGIFYNNSIDLVKDLRSGLLGLALQQIQAARSHRYEFDWVFAAGDIVPLAIARLTGLPYSAFIVSTSSYYEGRLNLPLLTAPLLRSSRCQQLFTRDDYTAKDLQQQGFTRAIFAGYPIMDVLTPTGKDLQRQADRSLIALLPGSRIPEACQNFGLQLALCEFLAEQMPVQICAALVPSFTEAELQAVASQHNWQYQGHGRLMKVKNNQEIWVECHWDAFADILHQCDLAIGMAGTAVEQAVGLGKPVIQIPGSGPQFTYAFAEAQMRLLGSSVQTIGTKAATPEILQQAADRVIQTLKDLPYLQACAKNGQERVGFTGGSVGIARHLVTAIRQFS